MKQYKPTYGVSLLYFSAVMCFSSIPAMIFMDVAIALEENKPFGGFLLMVLAGFGLWAVAAILLVWILSMVIGLFGRKQVELTEETITWEGKSIPLDKVRSLTLFLPHLSKFSSAPQCLMIWADNKNYMEIKRPSLRLIAALKKRCAYAVFDVDDWKGHLKQVLWIGLGLVAAILVFSVFGGQ